MPPLRFPRNYPEIRTSLAGAHAGARVEVPAHGRPALAPHLEARLGTLVAMPCIYPGPHSDHVSVEHPLPFALCRFDGARLLRDHVCRACNTEVGKKVETHFLRAGPTGFFRWMLGVRGRNGPPPSPFLAGAGGTPAIEMPGRLPDGEYDLLR